MWDTNKYNKGQQKAKVIVTGYFIELSLQVGGVDRRVSWDTVEEKWALW